MLVNKTLNYPEYISHHVIPALTICKDHIFISMAITPSSYLGTDMYFKCKYTTFDNPILINDYISTTTFRVNEHELELDNEKMLNTARSFGFSQDFMTTGYDNNNESFEQLLLPQFFDKSKLITQVKNVSITLLLNELPNNIKITDFKLYYTIYNTSSDQKKVDMTRVPWNLFHKIESNKRIYFNNIYLPQVPRKIIISCREPTALTGVDMIYGRVQGLFINVPPQLLYKMSKRNGYKNSYDEWIENSEIIIHPIKDLPRVVGDTGMIPFSFSCYATSDHKTVTMDVKIIY